MIGYLGFISYEWFLIARVMETHTYQCPHESNFKTPGVHRHLASVRLV